MGDGLRRHLARRWVVGVHLLPHPPAGEQPIASRRLHQRGSREGEATTGSGGGEGVRRLRRVGRGRGGRMYVYRSETYVAFRARRKPV